MTYENYEASPIFQQALADARRDLARDVQMQRPRRRRPGRRWVARALDVLLIVAFVTVALVGYGLIDNRWYRIVAIQGASMQPTLERGDAIVLTRPPEVLEEGMIVTLEVGGQVVTHRVVSVDADGGFVTRGDANTVADDWTGHDVEVIGVQRGRIPVLGKLLTILAGVTGSHAWQTDRVSVAATAGSVTCVGDCTVDGVDEQVEGGTTEESVQLDDGGVTSTTPVVDEGSEADPVDEPRDEVMDGSAPVDSEFIGSPDDVGESDDGAEMSG